ncbi:MAG: HNH endonuclease [Deltaproteobacteria bacterium]|nr:HNH endonuclease [Deltaproteobacteria bacterium]
MASRDTLLLDQGYQPVKIIPWQRAFVMQLVGKVEMVTAHEWCIRTVDHRYPAPAVVRLLRNVRHRPPFVRFSRENVYLRDGYRCQYCGDAFAAADLTLDHVVPRCQGGKTSWSNVVAACVRCNRRKGRELPDEAGMPLLATPRRPRWLAPKVMALGDAQMPPIWRDWLH